MRAALLALALVFAGCLGGRVEGDAETHERCLDECARRGEPAACWSELLEVCLCGEPADLRREPLCWGG